MQPSASLLLASPLQQRYSQQFLIPPFERLLFTALFTLATGVGWLLVGLALKSIQGLPLPGFWRVEGLLGTFVSGLVAGMMVGATQWLVLRRYVPDWLWMLASSAGYLMLMTTLQTWRSVIEAELRTIELPTVVSQLPPQVLLAVSGAMGTVLAALCAIWLGWLQWLVLRQYARPSWGWIFVPSMAVLLSCSVVIGSALLPLLHVALPLHLGVLTVGAIGATQAIALCGLQKKPARSVSLNPSLLAVAPEIFDYGQVQRIERRLRSQLHQAWKSDRIGDRPLIYWVGADEMGRIAAYEPVNASAIEFAYRTPLPELVHGGNLNERPEPTRSLARFQVIFKPSGSLKVVAWRGMPLLWLGMGLLLTIVAASALAGSLDVQLPG